jgi:pimeloyl-ACP methyl ester carboxylesterase
LHVSSIKKDIHILSYGYSDKKVLLAHGWAGRRTQLFMIANLLLEKGFMVIAFDAPSHGKSTGKTTNLVEYIASIKAIIEELGPFEAAVGHSFGAMAIMNTQANTKNFKSIITVGSG